MQKTLTLIDLRAIKSNALKIREGIGGKKFFAVVKAEAYGHGGAAVALYIEDVADCFCVAIIDEGIALRLAGVTKPILVFTPPLDGADILRARFYNLTVTVNSVKTARLARGLSCHIKVNTGMNRLGCGLAELPKVLSELDGNLVHGIYSHLYAPENAAASERQLAIFCEAEKIAKFRYGGICAHLSASGGFLRGGKYLFDGVRCGILLYGYAPAGFSCGFIKPAKKVFARRVQTTAFMGGGAGYGVARKNYKTLCAYRAGYADGFNRSAPFGENNLCMDAFIREGGRDWECVLGDAQSYAKSCGTIPYEVLVSAGRRSEMVYER